MEDTAICVCSHVYDEHESGGKECTVLMALERGKTEQCGCVMFEPDEL